MSKRRLALSILGFTMIFMVLIFPLTALSQEETPIRKVERIVIVPYQGGPQTVDFKTARILPNRLGIFLSQIPGFMVVESPPSKELLSGIKNSQQISAYLADYFAKIHGDFMILGFVEKDNINIYVVAKNGGAGVIKIESGDPYEAETFTKIVRELGRAGISLPEEFDEKVSQENLKLILWKSKAAFKYYIEAEAELLAGSPPEKVLPLVEQCLKITPDDVPALILQSRIYTLMGNYLRAEIIVDGILREHPDFLPAIMQKGVLLMNMGKSPEAVEVYKKALERFPQNVLLLYDLALSYERSGLQKEAEATYREILRIDPLNDFARYNLAVLYYDQREFSKALSLFEEIEKNDSSPEGKISYQIAMLYLTMGEIDKAEAKLIEISQKGNYKEVFNDLGLLYMSKGNFTAARVNFEKAIKADPEYAAPHNNLGLLYLKQNNKKRAKKEFEKALKIMPSHTAALYNLGLLSLEKNDYNGAEIYFKKALDSDPYCYQAKINLGVVEIYKGDPQKARSIYEEILKEQPDDPTALYNFAVLSANSGDWAEALESYKRIIGRNPENADVLNNIGIIYLTRKDYSSAADYLDRALKISPENGDFLFNRGLVAYDSNKFSEAEEYFEKALKEDEKNLPARLYLARALLAEEKYPRAKQHLDYLIKKSGGDYHILYLSAVYNERTGNPDRAAKILEKIAPKMKNNNEAYRALSGLYISMGKIDKAKALYEDLVKKDPKNPENHLGLGQIYALLKKGEEAEEEFGKSLKAAEDSQWGIERAQIAYEAALSFASLKDKNRCLKFLQAALKIDGSLKTEAASEPLLEPFRQEPEFVEILK